MDSKILEDVLEGLLKNAIENTPDEGMIQIHLEQENQKLLLKVQDFGVWDHRGESKVHLRWPLSYPRDRPVHF